MGLACARKPANSSFFSFMAFWREAPDFAIAPDPDKK
jgi:hypothetical protein